MKTITLFSFKVKDQTQGSRKSESQGKQQPQKILIETQSKGSQDMFRPILNNIVTESIHDLGQTHSTIQGSYQPNHSASNFHRAQASSLSGNRDMILSQNKESLSHQDFFKNYQKNYDASTHDSKKMDIQILSQEETATQFSQLRTQIPSSKMTSRPFKFSLQNFGDAQQLQLQKNKSTGNFHPSDKNSIFERLYKKSGNIQLEKYQSPNNKNLDLTARASQTNNLFSSQMSKTSNLGFMNPVMPGSFSHAIDLVNRRKSKDDQDLAKAQAKIKNSVHFSTLPMSPASTQQEKDYKTILLKQRQVEEDLKKKSEEYMENKQRQRDDILRKQTSAKEEMIQQQKDKIERRLLRSKISKTLKVFSSTLCKTKGRRKERLNYIKIKAAQGIAEMEEKYNHLKTLKKPKNESDEEEEDPEKAKLQTRVNQPETILRMRFPNPEADYYKQMVPEYPLTGCKEHDPNEIIVTKFNFQELQMINEDPNYFIKSKKMRDNVHLFDTQEDEFSEDKNAKVRGKIIKEEFHRKKKMERVLEEIQKFEEKYGADNMPDWMIQQFRTIQEEKFGKSDIFSPVRSDTGGRETQDINRESTVSDGLQRKKSLWKMGTTIGLPKEKPMTTSQSLKQLRSSTSQSSLPRQSKEAILESIKRREELKRQSVLEKYQKKLRQAENQKEEERRKKLTQMIEKQQKTNHKLENIYETKSMIREDKALETKYLNKVQDQMQKRATKENKLKNTVEKLLPLKLHLMDWEDKLKLTEKTDDSYEQKIMKSKEEKFDRLIEQLYRMEWNKLREDNAQEFQYIKNNVFRKIQQAETIINNL